LPTEQRLVETERVDVGEAVRVLYQRRPEPDDSIHDRVPITPQIVSDRATVMTDLERRPPTRTIRDRRTCRSDPIIDLGPRPHIASRVRAPPTLLGPHRPSRPPEHRQINQHHIATTVIMNTATTALTHRSSSTPGDLD
jgi:hypothetical protein